MRSIGTEEGITPMRKSARSNMPMPLSPGAGIPGVLVSAKVLDHLISRAH
jgi:hypothetical protein